MPLPKKITSAIASRTKANPTAPCNVFNMGEDGLKELRYKEVKLGKEGYQDGDIIPLSKAKDLWCVIDTAHYLRKNLGNPIGKSVVMAYRK